MLSETKSRVTSGKKIKLEKIKEILKNHKQELKKNFKVKRIGIFGSYIKGIPNNKSDIDILVEYNESF